MRQNNLSEKQRQLQSLIRRLVAAEEPDSKSISQEIRELYADEWRHHYSVLFPVLLQLYEQTEESNNELDTLLYRLEALRNDSCSFDNNTLQKLEKLWDHVSLEIQRIRCWGPIQRAHGRLASLSNDMKEASTELQTLKRRQNRMTSHYITILGIFAAIIMGANSVIAISSTVLSTIAASSPINLCIGGIVYLLLTLNIIFALAWTITRETLDDRRKLWLCWFLGIMNSLLIIGMVVLAMLSFNSAEAMPKEEEQLEPYCFVACNLYNRRIAL